MPLLSSTLSEKGLRKIQTHLATLRRDLGAVGAILFDEAGRLLLENGHAGEFDKGTFLVLLGNAMSAANAVVHVLRDSATFDLQYHEGKNLEIYTSRITDQVFLTLIFEKHASRVGLVWMTLRREIPELRAMVKEAVIKPGTTEDREIKNAISQSLGDALDRLDGELRTRPAASRDTAGSDDSDPIISYDEARRRGLLDLDKPTDQSQ